MHIKYVIVRCLVLISLSQNISNYLFMFFPSLLESLCKLSLHFLFYFPNVTLILLFMPGTGA